MNDGALKLSIFRCLRHGKAQAITGSRLAELLGQRNDRGIRLAIRELIAEGVPVASSVHAPYLGFYIVSTLEEAEEYEAVMTARISEDAARQRDFRSAFQQAHGEGRQISLKL